LIILLFFVDNIALRTNRFIWSDIFVKISIDDPNVISIAVKHFLKGSIVVFPTDTCYGLGTISVTWNEKNISQIFEIKARPIDQPLSLLITKDMLSTYIKLTPKLRKFLDRIWPGQVTVILSCSSLACQKLSPLLNVHNNQKLAFRVPNYRKLLEIIKKVGDPIIGTSANRSGSESKYDIFSIYQEFPMDNIHLWIDGGRLPYNPPSAIIDLTDPINPKIIREGKFNLETIWESFL
jgi:L-threonylcarbamoyladenylate synthase